MITTLGIVLAVLIVLNIWLGAYSVKWERERRKKLQERLDECDERIGEMMNELGLARQHLDEAQSLYSSLKKNHEKLLAAYEDMKLAYDRAKKEKEESEKKYRFLAEQFNGLQKICAKLQKENEELKKRLGIISDDPHADPQEPVDGGTVNGDVTPTEPFMRKMKVSPLALDFQDLKKSYDELAKRYENPSKTYLVRNLVKVYDVQSRTQLAKALGVSQQSINQMLRKK